MIISSNHDIINTKNNILIVHYIIKRGLAGCQITGRCFRLLLKTAPGPSERGHHKPQENIYWDLFYLSGTWFGLRCLYSTKAPQTGKYATFLFSMVW